MLTSYLCLADVFVYRMKKYKRKSMLVPTQARPEWVIGNPPSGSFELTMAMCKPPWNTGTW